MVDAPPGYDDMVGDAELSGVDSQVFRPLTVDGVGEVLARRPMPNSVPVLMHAARAVKLPDTALRQHIARFVTSHLEAGEWDRICEAMMTDPDIPPDAIERIAEAVATWGTARPTMPSRTSRS